MQTYKCISLHTHIHVYKNKHTNIHAYIYAYLHTYIHTYIIYIRMHTDIHIVATCMYVCGLCVHTYMHSYYTYRHIIIVHAVTHGLHESNCVLDYLGGGEAFIKLVQFILYWSGSLLFVAVPSAS